MQNLGLALMSCLGLSTAQQMCVQGSANQPNSVITFDSAFTGFTSTIEDSKIDVSKVNTTGEILIKEPDYNSRIGMNVMHPGVKPYDGTRDESIIRMLSLIVTVGYQNMDDDDIAQVFIQKNGKVGLIETFHKYSGSGSIQRHDVIHGLPNSEVPDLKLGYMMLTAQKNVQEFHQTGYLGHGDTIRLVTGKMDCCGHLDVSVCILYN